ncbi:MAG: PEP-CTERM sorting domain-containing protein [Planctomycetales bacterium]|nr:PEP-CTERM sorting domain-containing protein [Planctomycetales bacterium]
MKAIPHRARAATPSLAVLILVACLATPAFCQLTLSGGLTLVEEGPNPIGSVPANLATGAIPFTSSDLGPQLGIGFHIAANLNDQVYGNSNSWISADADPFAPTAIAGIDLGGLVSNVQSIAFGRDSTLGFFDRHQGLYTLQYTQVPDPSTNLILGVTGDPSSGWAEIGTLNYGASDGPGTNYNTTSIRHRYNFSAVDATGVRLIVPGNGLGAGTAIDEIELYDVPGAFVPPPPPPPPFAIVTEAGFTLTWDGNDGDAFDSGDPVADPNAARVQDNLALASNGAVAFTSSDLGPTLGLSFHVAANINDGIYGNSNSWIGAAASGDFAGVALNGEHLVTSVAWGRDNGNGAVDDSFAGSDACGGQCDDRWPGNYTLQFTQVGDPATAAFTGDPTTGWATIGAVNYSLAVDGDVGGGFTPFLRHEFDVRQNGQPISATGIRIADLAGGTAIDELEVYSVPEPSSIALIAAALLLCGLRRRR